MQCRLSSGTVGTAASLSLHGGGIYSFLVGNNIEGRAVPEYGEHDARGPAAEGHANHWF